MSVGIEVVLLIFQKAPLRQHGLSQTGVWVCKKHRLNSRATVRDQRCNVSTSTCCVPQWRVAQITLTARAKFSLFCKKEERTDASQQSAVSLEAFGPLSRQKGASILTSLNLWDSNCKRRGWFRTQHKVWVTCLAISHVQGVPHCFDSHQTQAVGSPSIPALRVSSQGFSFPANLPPPPGGH